MLEIKKKKLSEALKLEPLAETSVLLKEEKEEKQERQPFKIVGEFTLKTRKFKFTKTVQALNEYVAREKALSLIGSEHKIKRRFINIKKIKHARKAKTPKKKVKLRPTAKVKKLPQKKAKPKPTLKPKALKKKIKPKPALKLKPKPAIKPPEVKAKKLEKVKLELPELPKPEVKPKPKPVEAVKLPRVEVKKPAPEVKPKPEIKKPLKKKAENKEKRRGLFGWFKRGKKKPKEVKPKEVKPKPVPKEKKPLSEEGTIYDRIFELIKEKKSIKGGAIKKALKIDSKTLSHCIEVLEDSDLIEVNYPPIGDVRLTYKKPKAKEGGL